MKKLLSLALLTALPSFAFAGYDISTKNVPTDFTEATQDDLSSDYYIPVFNTSTGDSELVDGAVLGAAVQFYNDAYTSAEVEAGTVAIAGVTGKVLKVSDISLMSNGAAAGATTVDVECTGGTNILSAPVSVLTDDRTVGKYTSAPAATAPADFWTSAALAGCPSGEGIQVIATGGALTGSTDFKIEVDYVWQ